MRHFVPLLFLISTALSAVFADRPVVSLPEVVVGNRDRQVLHMLGYLREYSTLTTYGDTIFLFREKTVDFMVPSYKVKNFKGWLKPRILASRSYFHFTSGAGLDSVSDRFGQHFSWSDWVGLNDNIEVPNSLRTEITANDTVFGRYSPARIWRRTGEDMSLDINMLADSINAPWVPDLRNYIYGHPGTVEFNEFKLTLNYKGIDNTILLVDNLDNMTFDIETSGRARNMFRVFRADQPLYVSTHAELYIIDREYIPVKLAKNWDKNANELTEVGILVSPEAPPLEARIVNLKDRVESIDHVGRHLDTPLDRKVAGLHFDEMRYSRGVLGYLYKHFGFRF